jgi:hypothetical protein
MIQVPIHTINMVKKFGDKHAQTSAYLAVLNGVILSRGVLDMKVSAPADETPIATVKYDPKYLDEEVREMFKQYM